MPQTYKKHSKEIVHGKNRVIYTRSGSRAKYIKHKGNYVRLSEYKKMSGGGLGYVRELFRKGVNGLKKLLPNRIRNNTTRVASYEVDDDDDDKNIPRLSRRSSDSRSRRSSMSRSRIAPHEKIDDYIPPNRMATNSRSRRSSMSSSKKDLDYINNKFKNYINEKYDIVFKFIVNNQHMNYHHPSYHNIDKFLNVYRINKNKQLDYKSILIYMSELVNIIHDFENILKNPVTKFDTRQKQYNDIIKRLNELQNPNNMNFDGLELKNMIEDKMFENFKNFNYTHTGIFEY